MKNIKNKRFDTLDNVERKYKTGYSNGEGALYINIIEANKNIPIPGNWWSFMISKFLYV